MNVVDEYKVELRHESLRLLAKNEETSKAGVQLAFLISDENTIALSNGLNIRCSRTDSCRQAFSSCSHRSHPSRTLASSLLASNTAGNCADPALYQAIIKVFHCCTGNNGAIMAGAQLLVFLEAVDFVGTHPVVAVASANESATFQPIFFHVARLERSIDRRHVCYHNRFSC